MTIHRRQYLRHLYAIEILLFALPSIGILAPFLGALAFFAFGGLIAFLFGLLSKGEFNAEHMLFAAGGCALVVAALTSLWNFSSLSIYYLSNNQIWTQNHRRKFWVGIVLAIFPILFTTAAAMREINIGSTHILWIIYMSGLPMLIPVFHLGLITRNTV